MKEIKFYGADWCGDCLRAQMFLDTNKIEYQKFDISQDENAVDVVMEINGGKKVIPTILIDGKAFTNPSNPQLAEILEIK